MSRLFAFVPSFFPSHFGPHHHPEARFKLTHERIFTGLAANHYRGVVYQRHLTAVIEAEKQAAEARRRDKMLQDAYSDRTNLDELERAMAVYELSSQV